MTHSKSNQRVFTAVIALLLFLSVFAFWGETAHADGNNGWVKKDGKWFYYQNDQLKTGWLKNNGVWYYLDPDNGGAMSSNEIKMINGSYYYLTPGGKMAQNGWHKVQGGKYNEWVMAYPSGVLRLGWYNDGVNWYFFTPQTLTSSVHQIDDALYYFYPNGICHARAGWFSPVRESGDKVWYYANNGGSLKIGWFKYFDKWYYLKPKMFHSGIHWINNYYFYFEADGACRLQEGWFIPPWSSDQDWHYVDKGGSLRNGWLKYQNKWYYLNPSMLKNGTYELNHVKYTFDENGVWIP